MGKGIEYNRYVAFWHSWSPLPQLSPGGPVGAHTSVGWSPRPFVSIILTIDAHTWSRHILLCSYLKRVHTVRSYLKPTCMPSYIDTLMHSITSKRHVYYVTSSVLYICTQFHIRHIICLSIDTAHIAYCFHLWLLHIILYFLVFYNILIICLCIASSWSAICH